MPGQVNVALRWARAGSAPVITTASLPSGIVNSAYSQTLVATGTEPITWSIVSGSISPLTLNSSTGAITGTPSTPTTLSATFRATNAYGTNDKALSIVVSAAGGPVLIESPSIYVWRAA